jgi:uncharacterized protein
MSIRRLISKNRLQILRLAENYGVIQIRLFGSASHGDDTKSSDIDFLVEYEEGRSLLDHVALKQNLEELLGHKVDLVTAKALHWYIKDKVLSQAVSI